VFFFVYIALGFSVVISIGRVFNWSGVVCGIADKSLLDQCDIISDSSGVGTSNSGGSGGGYDTGACLLLAGVTAVCVENYSSNLPGHLCLTQGDIVEGV
jgi:hypothetical protein